MKTTNRFGHWLLALCCACMVGVAFTACDDDETYADQKKAERKAINAFLNRDPLVLVSGDNDTLLNTSKITVISESTFEAQDSTTDVEANEYVLFSSSGVYMQIVRKGAGEKLQDGETAVLMARYWEWNIKGDSLMTTNLVPYYNSVPEYIDVSNTSGTITGSFNTEIYPGGGAMYRTYSTTSVPEGWLVPLSYVNIGRQTDADSEISKVRLIVPHSSGTSAATNSVYPCFYEITFQRMR